MALSIYALSMPLLVYVTRADLSNLFSQWMKHILFPVVLIVVTADVLEAATRRVPTSGLSHRVSAEGG
jgi:hypothetical protein